MTNPGMVALMAVSSVVSTANAQPATAFRFSNGTNAITVEPGTAVPVLIFATSMPWPGSPIPWTTPPGTGQIGQYAGFKSVSMNTVATGGSWSGLTIPPPFVGPPFGSAGTVAGTNVNGINIGVGFGPPIAYHTFLLWQGTLTVGVENVSLATAIQPVGNPPNGPNLGFACSLGGILPGNPTQFLTTANGTAMITVPAPTSLALLGLGGLAGARRRR